MSGSVEIDLASQARMIDALRISLRATQVLQTHLSYVVLTGGIAYKVKKAVDLGFLDFRSLASRRRDCDRELRIDRAFAPDLYLDVVAVTGSVDTPHIGGAGPVLDYAVRMREFPQEAVAAHALARGAIGPAWVDALAANIADAHLRAAVDTTRAEEERFLSTIEGGMKRFDELAPAKTTQGSTTMHGTISGEDAFKLYDTFGFPIDLTELMARERGYSVDISGFESALQGQRTQSQEDRRSKKIGIAQDVLGDGDWAHGEEGTAFVGYDSLDVSTDVIASRDLPDGRVAVMLRETPFYVESGGQISDRGEIQGEGWRVDVDEVRKVDGRIAALGKASGKVTAGRARAVVPRDRRRDTERNHTATHLLHAALRQVLGVHVHQQGSLVAPDRLRFDFTHHGPLTPQQVSEVETLVNRGILDGVPLTFEQKPKAEAISMGAMSLFGEKYGDVVRVVSVPGISLELCGGTHVRNTSEIGVFKIVSETGIAAGVRRIEALTGRAALELFRAHERQLQEIEHIVRAPGGQAVKRVQALVDERRVLDKRLGEVLRSGGGGAIKELVEQAEVINGVKIVAANVIAPDLQSLQTMGDALREQMKPGVGVLGASLDNGKNTMVTVVSDGLPERGVRADNIMRELATAAGGKGGGKPHMAQAGIPDAGLMASVVAGATEIIRKHLAAAG